MMLPDQFVKVVRRLVHDAALGAVVARAARAQEAKLVVIALLVDEKALELPGRGEAHQPEDLRQLDPVAVHDDVSSLRMDAVGGIRRPRKAPGPPIANLT